MEYWLQYLAIAMTLIGFIFSLNAFRLNMPKPYKQFSYFLLFVFLGEMFAYAWQRWLYKLTPFPPYNQWFYNLFHFASYLFLLYFFYQVLRLHKVKALLKILGGLYVAFALTNLFFIQGFVTLNTYSELLASIILIYSCIAYYYQLLFDKKIIIIKNDTLFWISSGVLLSHLGSVLAIYLINKMTEFSREKADLFLMLIQFTVVLTYVFFSIAFICQKKK
jgi:hypothetical protein